MKPHFKSSCPVVRNRASVINSDLTLRMYSKEQLELIVAELVKMQLYPNFSVSVEVGDSLQLDVYVLTINDVPWATNIIDIAKMLKKYDYNAN